MKFFVLRRSKVVGASFVTDFVPTDGSRTGEAPRCARCGRFVGMLPLLPPVRVEVEVWGNRFGDIAFGPGDELLVTDRFWHLFRTSGLTGLVDAGLAETVRVNAHRKLQSAAPLYRCCQIARSNAAINDLESGLDREQPETCSECRLGGIIKRARRLVLVPGSWSGEDIFFARGLPGTVMTSERFDGFIRQNRYLNCEMVPAEAFSFDHYPWEKLNNHVTRPDI